MQGKHELLYRIIICCRKVFSKYIYAKTLKITCEIFQ